MTTTMRFRCPLCDCTSFEAVQIDRPGRAPYTLPLFACCGCSAAFADPVRFTLRDRGAYQRMMLPKAVSGPLARDK
jgi:rRNA maturation protein Nop10